MTSGAMRPIGALPSRTLPAWRVRLLKFFRRTAQRIRTLFRIRRGVLVRPPGEGAGYWYKELSAVPLAKALAGTARVSRDNARRAEKAYRVTFPDGSKQIIRCTATDVYADLMGSVGLEHYFPLATLIRPGSRILEIGAGTGYRAAWLSSIAGPSGSVVAVGNSSETIEFAQKRYRRPNIAFEVGSAQTLSGETDFAFDAVIVSATIDDGPESGSIVRELWRVLRPGGLLVAHICESGEGAEAPAEQSLAALRERFVGESTAAERQPVSAIRRFETAVRREHRQLFPVQPGDEVNPRAIRVDQIATPAPGVLLVSVIKPDPA